ncbi:MAG: HAMP domain-containing histidine kinase [Tannerella sp.]|jgi:signal transduction histidine kinase|nr:HAMP domain-containing histidine kinase [Tannerella sp.]
MKKLSLQSRIAFNCITSTAILTGILCAVILLVISIHANRRINDISVAHRDYFMQRLSVNNGQLTYGNIHPDEAVNAGIIDRQAVYVEIFDNSGNRIYSSPNLQNGSLPPEKSSFELNGEKIRLKKLPVQIGNKTEGCLLIAVAAGDMDLLMTILFRVCMVGFFFNLALQFITSRIIAKNSIKPIREIIDISNTITHNSLDSRIPLPNNQDELYELSDTVNKLLDRIECAIEREKSFTSYASHEFRTPLSVLKGTMEVLIRRPRSEDEYRKRITACIKEVDKLNGMIEQMLILTRYEDSRRSLSFACHTIESLIHTAASPFCDAIIGKKLEMKTSVQPRNISLYTDEYALSVILNNLISNAVKYSHDGGVIDIKAYRENDCLIVEIQNSGHGIPQEELDCIFEKFYRSRTPEQPEIKGFGLGLPIVKRFCSLLNIDISITSEPGKNTMARLTIPLYTARGISINPEGLHLSAK